MLRLTFLTIGDLPKGPFHDLALGWEKQLKAYVKLEKKVLRDEAGIIRLLDQLTPSVLLVLEATGKALTSEGLAQWIGEREDHGEHVVAILGGPRGLSDNLKGRADLLLSLSPMTTTHDLAHLFFLEQLYRAFTILRGKTYHY
jgi:23S rRNA (pseudouridine1915-N3)-methyltransferase